jgi:hypothetical protein
MREAWRAVDKIRCFVLYFILNFGGSTSLWRFINKIKRTMQNVKTPPILILETDNLRASVLNAGIFASLVDKGLNRLTDAEIEHIMCTSSLAAFN